jgi:NADH pyrophosphatase NudC (nudix superfamily)
MEIAALLLTIGVIILVGLYLYAPFLDRKAVQQSASDQELSAVMAERDRVVTSLQELDFDYKLGKIPEEDYPVQRAFLLQKGADVLKQIDALTPSASAKLREQNNEDRIEKAVAARRAGLSSGQAAITDDEIESMIAARRKTRKDKSAGFCPQCGKPVLASDRFCPSCGKTL